MLRGYGGVSMMLALLAASSGVGCAAHGAEQQRSLAALERAERALDEERQRLLLIEQRLFSMEATRRLEASRVERLELQQLLVASERVLAEEPGEAGPSNAAEPSAEVCSATADPRAQLRYWLERLRNDPAHAELLRGGLAPAALEGANVLSRGGRSPNLEGSWPGF